MIQSVCSSIIPLLVSFYFGAWADIFGRKILMYAFVSAQLLCSSIHLISAIFMRLPKEILIAAFIPVTLTGTLCTGCPVSLKISKRWMGHMDFEHLCIHCRRFDTKNQEFEDGYAAHGLRFSRSNRTSGGSSSLWKRSDCFGFFFLITVVHVILNALQEDLSWFTSSIWQC